MGKFVDYSLSTIESDFISQLYSWERVFISLSIKRFNRWDLLDLPIEQSDDLYEIYHDVALKTFLLKDNPEYQRAKGMLLDAPNPEIVSLDILNNVATDATYIDKFNTLFQNTFQLLHNYGYAEQIFRWGQQTRIYIKHNDRFLYEKTTQLKSISRLFREWAVLRWLEVGSVDDTNTWDDVITKYTPIYTGELNAGFEHWHPQELSLAEKTKEALMVIILGYEAQQLQIETLMNNIVDSSMGRWEYYALTTGLADIAIPFEGRHRINQKVWQHIQRILTQGEQNILNEWILKHQEHYPELESPLPDFTNLFHTDRP